MNPATEIAPTRCPCCHSIGEQVFVRSAITHELICQECNKALDQAEAAYLSRL